MIRSHAASSQGPQHNENQDTFLIDEAIGLFIVADGMGGQSAGDVASRLTAETIHNFISQSFGNEEVSWPFGIDADLSLEGNRLVTAIRLANRRVWREAEQRIDYLGMGSTVVAAIVAEGLATVCSAGDSRLYKIADESITQVTKDDSWVREAVAEGLIETSEAARHPMRNIITNAIGIEKMITPNVASVALEPGDDLLFCSDGLYKVLSDDEILELVVSGNDDLEATVGALITAAVNNDSDDDVTALMVQATAP